MKLCSKCKIEKSFDEFSKQSVNKSLYRSRCKLCSSLDYQEYYKKNKEKVLKKSKKYYSNREVVKGRNLRSRFWPDLNYKEAVVRYNEMLKQQNGVCAICNMPETMVNKQTGITELAVDHCHITGEVRGLLCRLCNSGLGSFRDNIESLNGAILYLKNKLLKKTK